MKLCAVYILKYLVFKFVLFQTKGGGGLSKCKMGQTLFLT